MTRSIMQTAIQTALPFAARSATLPILEHLLVQSRRVVACDLTTEIEIAVAEDFGLDAAIPANRLAPLIDILDRSAIDGDEKGRIVIRHGKSRYRIATLPADDFPRIAAKGEPLATLTLAARELAHRLAKALIAAAKGDIRYYLNGVAIEQSKGELAIVATDGHRLIAQRLDAQASADFAIILPREAVGKIVKWLGKAKVDATLTIFDGLAAIETPGAAMRVKCVDGKFPDWRKILCEPPLAASVEREALIEALRRAAGYAAKKFNGLHVEIGDGEIAIEAAGSGDGSEARVVIPAETHATVAFGINLRYLRDAVQTAEAERIGIRSDGETDKALRIEPEPTRGDYLHIVMPMRE